MPVPNTIKIWVNAFIPSNVPGVTYPLPQGGTVVLDPADGTIAYGTNNRGFSSNIHAQSKMHSEVLLSRTTQGQWNLTSQWSNSDPVNHYSYPDGRLVETRRANVNNCRWQIGGVVADPVAGIAFRPGVGQQGVSFHCQVSNPHLRPGPTANAGAVDADLSFAIDERLEKLSVNGVVDDFPAFEIYAAFNNGAPVKLLQAFPRPGMSPLNLLGPPLNSVSGEVRW